MGEMAPKNSFWLREQHENVVCAHSVFLKKEMWAFLEKKKKKNRLKTYMQVWKKRICQFPLFASFTSLTEVICNLPVEKISAATAIKASDIMLSDATVMLSCRATLQ